MVRIVFVFVLLLSTFAPVQAQVQLASDSSSIEFGGVKIPGHKDIVFMLVNPTAQPLQIDNIVPSGGSAPTDFSVLIPTSFPVIVKPRDSVIVILRFTPKFKGDRTTSLDVETQQGQLLLTVHGKGESEDSHVHLSKTSIDFGVLGFGAMKDSIIQLVSEGPDSATITGMQVALGGNDISFEILPLNPLQPQKYKLAPKDSVAYIVRFHGTNPIGKKSGTITIFTDAALQPTCDLHGDVETGTIGILPPSIDFGKVFEGESRDTTITIHNGGNVTVIINGLTSLSDSFRIAPLPQLPDTLLPGQDLVLHLHFVAKQKTSNFTQLYVITSNTQTKLQGPINLKASVAPSPLVSATSQETYPCAKPTVTVPIRFKNAANVRYVITGLRVIRPASSITIPNMPDTVSAGGTVFFSIDLPASHPDTVIVAALGNNIPIAWDTLVLHAIPVQLNSTVAFVSQTNTSPTITGSVYADAHLSDYPVTSIRVRLRSDNTDVASIVQSSLQPSQSIAALVGGYKLNYDAITGTNEILMTFRVPQLLTSLAGDSSIVTFNAVRTLSKDSVANIISTLSVPDDSGCLYFSEAQSQVHVGPFCGSTILERYLNQLPLITSARAVYDNSGGAHVLLVLRESSAIGWSLMDISGAVISHFDRSGISKELTIDVPSSRASGVFYLLIRAATPNGDEARTMVPLILTK